MSQELSAASFETLVVQKAGMTRIFKSDGQAIPVTVLKIIPNIISQIKTNDKDGYSAYQVAYNAKREKLVNKSVKGQLEKASIKESFDSFYEIRKSDVNEGFLGKALTTDVFKTLQFIDATAITKGKGFQGVMKRHNFQGGPAAHGSHFHRRPGSIGNRATPARVFPEKKMPGQMGLEKSTVQNLQIVEVDDSNGYILVKGSVPGGKNSFIRISKAIKK